MILTQYNLRIHKRNGRMSSIVL